MSVLGDFRAYKENRARVSAVVSWAKRHGIEEDQIDVSLPHFRRRGDPTKAALRVGAPSGFSEQGSQLEWVALFTTPAIELWVRRSATLCGELRFPYDLVESEKRELLRVARRVAEHYVRTQKKLPASALVPGSSRLHRAKVSVDIAYWIDGNMRASMIVENAACIEAVAAAAIKALHDPRFKPLTVEDLSHARIELTVWSDLYIPLMPSEIERGDIYFEKLYVATDGERSGWYLPEVFNCVSYRGLGQFLDSLARQKGGFPLARASVHVAEVTDIMESGDHMRALSLTGAMPQHVLPEGDLGSHHELIRGSAANVARHLISLQSEDGWMRAIVDPVQRNNRFAVNWPQLAFVGWALGEWGTASNSTTVLAAAKLLVAYCARSLETLPLSSGGRVLCAAYLGKAAMLLGDLSLAETQKAAMMQRIGVLSFEPITMLQGASFLLLASDPAAREHGRKAFEAAMTTFIKTKENNVPISLASYAELIPLSRLLEDPRESVIRTWYKELQHIDGSFPNTTDSNFAYTRGTGKIFEAMCRYPEQYEEKIVKSLRWLLQMQYDSENLYFVEESEWDLLIGGFRHDMGNPAAWVDAAGHFLIGCARLLSKSSGRGEGL